MISKIWNRLWNREGITYVIFGVLTTAVDWAAYAILWAMGMDYRVSTALSWAAMRTVCFRDQQVSGVPQYGVGTEEAVERVCVFCGLPAGYGSFYHGRDDSHGGESALAGVCGQVSRLGSFSGIELYIEQTVYL